MELESVNIGYFDPLQLFGLKYVRRIFCPFRTLGIAICFPMADVAMLPARRCVPGGAALAAFSLCMGLKAESFGQGRLESKGTRNLNAKTLSSAPCYLNVQGGARKNIFTCGSLCQPAIAFKGASGNVEICVCDCAFGYETAQGRPYQRHTATVDKQPRSRQAAQESDETCILRSRSTFPLLCPGSLQRPHCLSAGAALPFCAFEWLLEESRVY